MKNLLTDFKGMIRRRNLVPKLIAILLAVLLWAYITSTKMGEVAYRVPIEFAYLPSDLIVTRYSVKTVTLNLTGTKEALKTFNPKNVKVYVNLRKARTGPDQKFALSVNKEEVPEGIRMRLGRKSLLLSIEKRYSRLVRVVPVITGIPKEGFVRGEVTVNPEFVTAIGEESSVRELSALKTESVSIENGSKKIIRDIAVEVPEGSRFFVTPETVSVTVPLAPAGKGAAPDRELKPGRP